jgi:hypothetical protein
MRSRQLYFLAFCILILALQNVWAQNCSDFTITPVGRIASNCTEMTMTMRHDNTGKPFLYVAQKEGGLKIYDVSAITSPQLVKTIPITDLQELHVMNLSQQGNYLYLALGNSFVWNNTQNPGMAIIDVSNPSIATVTAVYKYPGEKGGGGIVKVEGDYAYLGAMVHGLVILDVSDKHNIKYVSEFLPDRNFPVTLSQLSDSIKYNVRGMEVRNGIVYACDDAGGFRIINTVDKLHPIETGRYSNPSVDARPRAYNNLVVSDTIAYVAVDYCGVEVLNVADISNVKLLSWYNPWDCDVASKNNWFNSNGHSNEIEYDANCHRLFLSAGRTDLLVVNAEDPFHLDSCATYGVASDDSATWGVSIYQKQIYISNICAVVPFQSGWTGVRILEYTPCSQDVPQIFAAEDIKVYPNPATQHSSVSIVGAFSGVKSLSVAITNIAGQVINVPYTTIQDRAIDLDLTSVRDGIYLINLSNRENCIVRKIVVQR